jgi:hypothetical protein
MSIRVSIYDLFAYTIPGGIVLGIVLYLNQEYQVFSFNFGNLSLLELIAMGILAYLLGYFIDPIAKVVWYRFFCPKNLRQATLNDFNKRHPDIEIPFQKVDWYISFAYIKRNSVEMVDELEHLKVTNIMLRNSSFGFLLFGIVFIFEFISHNFLPIYIIACVLCFVIAVVLVKQAVMFQQWFFDGIFQSLVVLTSEPKQTSIPVEKRSSVISEPQRKDKVP